MRNYLPADRIVEVIGYYGEKGYRLGSGCIVAGRVLLTAAHVISGAEAVIVRDAHKQILPTVWTADAEAFIGPYSAGGPDLALVELADPDIDFPPLALAGVDRFGDFDDAVEGCVTIGYPQFAQHHLGRDHLGRDHLGRDTVQAGGRIPTHSMQASGFLSLTVSSAPRDLPGGSFLNSEWSGMSGAPVLADGCLLGVVTEHAPREGASTITVTPLTAINYSPDQQGWRTGVDNPAAWWRRLGADPADPIQLLPRSRRESRYLSTVREIHIRNGLLKGREGELGELAAFAVGDQGYRLLVGEQYAGKTALLAEFVTTRHPGEVYVVSYFLSGNRGDADRDRFLAAVVPQLSEILGKPAPEASLQDFWALWHEAARHAFRRQRHLLLVVDGLDEDLAPRGSPSIGELLPSAVTGFAYPELSRAHVLVSNRINHPLPRDIPYNHPILKVEPVVLRPHAEASVYEARARQEIESLKAIGMDARNFLAALAAAAGPLAVDDIRELTSLPEATVGELVDRTQRSLSTSGPESEPRYAFASTSLLQKARADPDLRISRHRENIHRWADRWRSNLWQGHEGAADVPLYLLDAYPKTLGDEPERRAALVSDPGWVVAAIGKITVDLVLAELRTCVAATAGLTGPAGMLAVIRGQSSVLRSQPDTSHGQVLRQLCLQASELHETDLADNLRDRLSAYDGPIPRWTSRRPHRALVAEVNCQAGWINAIASTRDGSVVAGTEDGSIYMWNPGATVIGGTLLGTHDGPVRALAVDKSGRVISGGHDHCIWLWDPLGAERVEVGQHDGAVRALAVGADGAVISGGDDARLLIWGERATDAGPVELGRHAGAIRCIAVSPRGWVVSGADDRRLRLWDPAAPGVIMAQTSRLGGRIMAVAIAPDGSVVAGGTDSVLYRWNHRFSDPASGLEVQPGRVTEIAGRVTEIGGHHGVVRTVSIAREGMVISGGDDGRVLVWRTGDRGIGGIERIEMGQHDGQVRSVIDASDDRAVSGGQDQRLRLWDLREVKLSVSDSRTLTGPINAVCISPDGYLVSGGADKVVRVWDTDGMAAPVELGRLDSPAAAVVALPDGAVVACGSDGRLVRWDRIGPARTVSSPGSHNGAVLSATADSHLVSGGYDGRICLWNLAAGDRPDVIGTHQRPVTAMAVLRDGRVVTGDTSGGVMIWDPAGPRAEPIEMDRYPGRLNVLAALPDHVVGGGDDGNMWIWDLRGRKVGTCRSHDSWLTSLTAFSNMYLVSGGTDGQMSVWELAGRTLRRIGATTCSVRALTAAMHPRTGQGRLVVAHADAGISYWTLNLPIR